MSVFFTKTMQNAHVFVKGAVSMKAETLIGATKTRQEGKQRIK